MPFSHSLLLLWVIIDLVFSVLGVVFGVYLLDYCLRSFGCGLLTLIKLLVGCTGMGCVCSWALRFCGFPVGYVCFVCFGLISYYLFGLEGLICLALVFPGGLCWWFGGLLGHFVGCWLLFTWGLYCIVYYVAVPILRYYFVLFIGLVFGVCL